MARRVRAGFCLYWVAAWSLLGFDISLARGPARFVVVVAFSCAHAQAQTQAEPPEYRQLIGRAVREFDAGNFPEARGLFSRAHDVYPNARTHLGLGFTAFELRNYTISVENLELALASKIKPLDAKLRKSAEDVLGRARDNLAQVTLSISPSSGRVLVDGVPTRLPENNILVLEVGDHSIEIQASGYLGERRTLRLIGGEKLAISVVLHKPEAVAAPLVQSDGGNAAPRTSADQAPSERRPAYKSPWLWVGVGAVLVAGGVTAFLLLRDKGEEPVAPTVTDNTPSGGVLHALRSW
jgi:hypothetical protein